VNQLIALTAMVVPAACVWLDSTARRIALILFSVVVSYLWQRDAHRAGGMAGVEGAR